VLQQNFPAARNTIGLDKLESNLAATHITMCSPVHGASCAAAAGGPNVVGGGVGPDVVVGGGGPNNVVVGCGM
jgi:hypothetical protein